MFDEGDEENRSSESGNTAVRKIVLNDHEADRVGVAVAVVAGERRMIVHRGRAEGRAPRPRSDERASNILSGA